MIITLFPIFQKQKVNFSAFSTSLNDLIIHIIFKLCFWLQIARYIEALYYDYVPKAVNPTALQVTFLNKSSFI